MTHRLRRFPAIALTAAIPILFSAAASGPSWSQTPTTAQATAPIDQQQARAIAIDAYLYLYPLVMMDVTRRQITNIEPGKGFGGPMNTMANIRAYPTADDRAVVRPNFDTLYSSAFLDLRREPMVLSVPDTDGRYYLLPMLDMWTDVFASPGWRTTGTKAGTFLLVAQNWRPDARGRLIQDFKLPEDTEIIEAPTPYVWIIGRTKTDGPSDYPAVHRIQDGYRLTPLSQWGRSPEPVTFSPDPAVDMKTPPKRQVDGMSAADFFTYAAEVLKTNPPHLTDQPIIARMRRIGLEPGKSFDIQKLDTAIRLGVEQAPAEGQRLMAWKVPTMARVVNGWAMNTDTMGVYGNYYLKRAIIAQMGLGANVPEDAVYPLNLTDATSQPLDGTNRYRIHFDKNSLPPVDAFWSVTVYDQEGFQVPNALNRFAVSSWMPFRTNADGSLDLIIQNESPGQGLEANWLPTPKAPFNLAMRLYAPRSEVLTGQWNPPPVEKVSSATPAQ
jgi:hypothetical protein